MVYVYEYTIVNIYFSYIHAYEYITLYDEATSDVCPMQLLHYLNIHVCLYYTLSIHAYT